ncbi:actin-binding protein WASF3-like [Alosa pseudoharengus]|uniref:actin-binding protein WASF3-like n=1 Tax=Alosa pseudoharengus TaxID=34774 RepID=UPI003F8AC0D5
MPMLKRSVEPHHVCRTEIPECIEIELECVNNATLSAIIRQLSSLSKHAEDIFAELFQEASVFYLRTVSLQDRIDRLAAKVTQLDSSVEEVSLQDIHLRKAFHSCTAQDQHLVSKASIPTPITQMYRLSDKPPPLGALTQYREDEVDALKLYSDPSYFFDLWKERMMLATEEKRRERRRQREQKRGMHGTLPREVKRVRKVRDRREEWNRLALDKELRPDRAHTLAHTLAHAHAHTLAHTRVRPGHHTHTMAATVWFAGESRPPFPDFPATQPIMTNHRPPQPSLTNQHPPPPQRVEHEYHSIGGEVSIAVVYRDTPVQRRPTPHTAVQNPPTHTLTQTNTHTPAQTNTHVQTRNSTANGGSAVPPPADYGSCCHGASSSSSPCPACANRHWHGIQLKKVQEQKELRAKRQPIGNDVAAILSRRIAVEMSDSEEGEESDGEGGRGWSD